MDWWCFNFCFCLGSHVVVVVVTPRKQGLGITVFGIAYMFVHDGLVHKRFPVGPIADVPYLRKVAAAHQVLISLT